MGEIMSGRIKEQIDLVVGEAQGVGGAIAKRFVEEGGKGCDCRCLERGWPATAKRLVGTYVHTDIVDFEAAKQAVGVIVQNYGSLDITVQTREFTLGH